MDYLLATVVPSLLSAGLALLGARYVNRAEREESERDSFLLLRQDSVERAKEIARLEQRLDKQEVDVNRIGSSVREIRTVLSIASQTGEVPRYVPGSTSGEGQRL